MTFSQWVQWADQQMWGPGMLVLLMGTGGYLPEHGPDVQENKRCPRWDLESIITQEFSLCDLEKAIRTAADVDHAGNVVIKMGEK